MELISPEKDPLGRMLADFLAGDKKAYAMVETSDFEMSKMTGDLMFRIWDRMDALEKKALNLCRGKVLDIGAGSGCHSLVLQDRGIDVTAMDISPGCVDVMEKQGIRQVCQDSLFSHEDGPYDTLLMLMNGIGLCGSIEGLNLFFQQAKDLLKSGGQILADSTDLASAYTASMAASPDDDHYFGETWFSLSYKGIVSDPFDWLYIDFSTLAFYAEFHGWCCTRIFKAEEGRYLAKLYQHPNW